MWTSSEIKSALYRVLQQSELAKEINGEIRTKDRVINSANEDVVILVSSNLPAQRQEAVIYVNVYVPDILVERTYEESSRVRKLSRVVSDVLTGIQTERPEGLKFDYESMEVIKVESTHEHVISNKLLCKVINENKIR